MRKLLLVTLAALVALVPLHAQTASDNDVRQRMHDLGEISKDANSQQSPAGSSTPLLRGPDDDPTLAADTFEHEPPKAARKFAIQGEHFSKKQEHDKAIAAFQSALQIDARYYEAANNLALEYFSSGKSDQAIDTLRKLTKSDPKHVLAFDNLAIILGKLKRYPEAETVATEAYRMHPFSYKAAYVFGSSQVNQGKWTADAKQSLRYASERHPEAKVLLAKWPAQNVQGSTAR